MNEVTINGLLSVLSREDIILKKQNSHELCFGDPSGCKAEEAWISAKLQFLGPQGARPKFGKTESRVRGYWGMDRDGKIQQTGFLLVLLLSESAETGWEHALSAGEAVQPHPARLFPH